MTKWLSLLLLFQIVLLSALAASNPAVETTVYRLLLTDGQVIAYTEIVPQVGDYYWQTEHDNWYRVVRVEGDVGWLEEASPPADDTLEIAQGPITIGALVLVFIALVLLCLVYRQRK